jgi:hypothetical protein
MLSTARYHDLDDYMRRSLPVASMAEAGALFGAVHAWGDLPIHTNIDPTWSYAPPTAPLLAAPATAYLRRLLRSIVHPPPRDSRQVSCEHRPATMLAFAEAVAHLHRLGSIPAHVLVGFLEGTLAEQGRRAAGVRVKGKGSGGGGGEDDDDPAAHLTCYYELRALCRAFADRGVAPFSLLTSAALWGDSGADGGGGGGGSTGRISVKAYALPMRFSDTFVRCRGDVKWTTMYAGCSQHPVLGLAILRGRAAADFRDDAPADHDDDSSAGMFRNLMGMFGMDGQPGRFGLGNSPFGCLLRRAARAAAADGGGGGAGCPSVEVVSVLAWDADTVEARVLLCEDDAAALRRQGAAVVVYRTDSYDVLSMPAPWSRAKEVAGLWG